MAVSVLDTTYTIECTGTADDNLLMEIKITRSNNAVANLTDVQIVNFIRNQLAAATGRPATIFKVETVKTTE